MQGLYNQGLRDSLYLYEPTLENDAFGNIKWQNGTENEFKKRNIGLMCRVNKCDAFMTIDGDELHDLNNLSGK